MSGPSGSDIIRSVLIIQNARLEGPGHMAAALADQGVATRIVQAWSGENVPRSIAGHDGLIVLGGPPSAYDLASGPWMSDVISLLRATHGRAPILGICLGAQLAAHALGGLAKPGQLPEVGFVGLHWTEAARSDLLVGKLRGRVLELHHDTYELPPAAVRLASSNRYNEQAFRLGAMTYGLQFHVEMTAEQLAEILPGEAKDIEAAGIDVDHLLAEVRRRDAEMAEASRDIMAGFAGLA